MVLVIKPLDCADDDPNVVIIEELEPPEIERSYALLLLARKPLHLEAQVQRNLRFVFARR